MYSQAITESGGEMVVHNPVITQANSEDDMNAMILESMGLKAEDMTAFAASGSMMSVKAYGIAAVMPAEGKEEAVKAGLQEMCIRDRPPPFSAPRRARLSIPWAMPDTNKAPHRASSSPSFGATCWP